MKKFPFVVLGLTAFCTLGFTKELSGKNLEIVNIASETKLFVNDFEEYSEKLNYISEIEKKIAEYDDETSEEAKLICKEIFLYQKETLKAEEEFKAESNSKSKANSKKKEKNSEENDVIVQCYKEMESFSAQNSDLSSYFYFHMTEAHAALMQYLPVSKQIKFLTDMIESYEKIENQNPDNAENLFTRASFLYFMPKIAGGDKVLAEEKLKHGIETAGNKYEKASILMLLSQFLVEQKKSEEAKTYLMQAKQIAPDNKTINEIEKMNEAGYSMFDEKAYQKKVK